MGLLAPITCHFTTAWWRTPNDGIRAVWLLRNGTSKCHRIQQFSVQLCFGSCTTELELTIVASAFQKSTVSRAKQRILIVICKSKCCLMKTAVVQFQRFKRWQSS